MRDTDYARELARGTFEDARIERLYVKEADEEQIRFSYWKVGKKFVPRPLDLTEEDLLKLFADAIKENVFIHSFKSDLAELLTVSN